MILVGTMLLVTLGVLGPFQNDRKKESIYTVTLEGAACDPTRRLRCRYRFVEVSVAQDRKDKRHFDLLFYSSADQTEEKGDAISRLDQFFKIKREVPGSPGARGPDLIGYNKPVTLRIQGSKYEFSRADGEKVAVDREKKTRP